MAFTKEISHQLTVHEDGVVGVLRKTRVYEDGALVAERLHRSHLAPGDDLTGAPARAAAICNIVWTPAVIAAYRAALAEALARRP